MVPRSQDSTHVPRLDIVRRAVPKERVGVVQPTWRRNFNEVRKPGPGQAVETRRALVPVRPTKLGATAAIRAVISMHLSWSEALQNVLRSRIDDNFPRQGPRSSSSGGVRDWFQR
ncbi:uncharacterized protein LOC144866974 [Branchiostoma floridae x Branchiostoma japonicum]